MHRNSTNPQKPEYGRWLWHLEHHHRQTHPNGYLFNQRRYPIWDSRLVRGPFISEIHTGYRSPLAGGRNSCPSGTEWRSPARQTPGSPQLVLEVSSSCWFCKPESTHNFSLLDKPTRLTPSLDPSLVWFYLPSSVKLLQLWRTLGAMCE